MIGRDSSEEGPRKGSTPGSVSANGRGIEVEPDKEPTPGLDDISDRETLQRIQDALASATGIGSVIVDAQGRPWTKPSGITGICLEAGFGPDCDPCVLAHRELGLEARDGGGSVVRACTKCSGHEASTPMVIGDWHLGSWLCGPVVLAEEGVSPSLDESRPTMTRERFEQIVALLDETVRGLCAQGHRVVELRSDGLSRRRMSRHLDDVVNALADPVFVKDEHHRWVTLNSAFCKFMGVQREQLLGKSDFDFFPVDEARVFWREDDEAFRKGGTNTNEERFTDATGSTHIVSTKKTVFVGEGGTKYIVGVLRDITDRRKVEDELSKHRDQLEELVAERTLALSSANRMLQLEIDERRRAEAEKREMQAQLVHQQKLEAIGRLAGGIAHDFNNLLTGIFGHVTLALRDQNTTDASRDSLLQIREAAKRAADLTKQLLAFSRKQIIAPRIVDLNALIDNLRRLLERIIGEDIRLVTQYDPRLGSIRVDPVQLEQVVVNLVVNARDAMPAGGRLTLETMNRKIRDVGQRSEDSPPPGDYAVLVVSDTGAGMDEETQSRIFEPFFTTKQKGQGTGLGLATVYGIVKQHRGTILVTSTPGEGAIFQVMLPCVEVTGAEPQASPPDERIIGGTETVLLVEDEEVVRLATQGMLEHLGYKVLVAHDGASALRASEFHRGTIHLLFTDVVMPGLNGRELAETLRRVRPEMRVLYTSGYTDDVIVHHGVLDEGVDFISKPFDSAELARRVRKSLDG